MADRAQFKEKEINLKTNKKKRKKEKKKDKEAGCDVNIHAIEKNVECSKNSKEKQRKKKRKLEKLNEDINFRFLMESEGDVHLETIKNKSKKKKKKDDSAVYPSEVDAVNTTPNGSNYLKDKEYKKKRKVKKSIQGTGLDSFIPEPIEKNLEDSNTKNFTIKKKKKRKIDKELVLESQKEDFRPMKEISFKKKKLHRLPSENYKPGMLSDILQINKYGRVIIPWDPTFGLDKEYNENLRKKQKDDDAQPKLKINPLFDLSKRNRETNSFIDKTETSIFVGNLPCNTTILDVKKLFAKYGKIYKVKLKKKQAISVKKSKKIENESIKNVNKSINANIKFKTLKSVEAVLSLNGTLYKDHHLRVTLATDEQSAEQDRTVFVGNLAYNAQDDDLWKAFEDCGDIKSVRIIRDERSGMGKGFGYVNFKSKESVELAMKLEGKLVLDREIRVRRNDIKAFSLSNSTIVKKKRKKKKVKILPENKAGSENVKKELSKVNKVKKKKKKTAEESDE